MGFSGTGRYDSVDGKKIRASLVEIFIIVIFICQMIIFLTIMAAAAAEAVVSGTFRPIRNFRFDEWLIPKFGLERCDK